MRRAGRRARRPRGRAGRTPRRPARRPSPAPPAAAARTGSTRARPSAATPPRPTPRRPRSTPARRCPTPRETRSASVLPHYVAPPHKKALYLPPGVLKSYLPALVFLVLGIGVGTAFTLANNVLGPKRPGRTKSEPYESGLPSEVRKSFRFGISFYLIAMLFILFDIEVVFLYPVALQLDALGVFALVETVIFIVLLLIAFVFVWRRGALEWK